jgi:hypothetical protein
MERIPMFVSGDIHSHAEARILRSGEADLSEQLPALEENGFNIIDVERDRITVRSFRFDGENGDPAGLDTLEPFRESVFERT